MSSRACVVCDVSAVCFARGFVDARIELFKREFPRAYAYVTKDVEIKSGAHLRAAVQRTAAYVWKAIPIDCPENPLACSWGIEEFESPGKLLIRTVQEGINKQFEVPFE